MEETELNKKLQAIADGVAKLIADDTIELTTIGTYDNGKSFYARILDDLFVKENDGKLSFVVTSTECYDELHNKFMKAFYEHKVKELTDKADDAQNELPL